MMTTSYHCRALFYIHALPGRYLSPDSRIARMSTSVIGLILVKQLSINNAGDVTIVLSLANLLDSVLPHKDSQYPIYQLLQLFSRPSEETFLSLHRPHDG